MLIIFSTDAGTPTITNCPQNLSENLGTGPRRVVTWLEPTGRDPSGTTIVPTQTHRPGMMFELGETAVNYTFTASNGQTAVCSFTVTIVGKLINIELASDVV